MRSSFLALFLCVCLLAISSLAAESSYQLSGRAFADAYYPTHTSPDYTFQQLSASLWLQGDAHLSEALSARAIYQDDFFEGHDVRMTGDRSGTHLRNQLREGYAEYFENGWQVRAGKQIISWGKSDGINPTDFFSAKESSYLNHDAEVTRVAGLGILTSFTLDKGSSPWNITAVVQPVFPKSDNLIPPKAIPAGVSLLPTQKPDGVNIKDTEYALKLAYAGSSWDGSLSYFNGWDHSPQFAIDSYAPITLTRAFRPVHAIGCDASVSTENYVYRFETAYVWTDNNDGKNPLITPTHWDAVLGAEHPMGETLRWNLQFVSRYFPRYTPADRAEGTTPLIAQINQQVAAANALVQQYQDRWITATALRGAYTNDESGVGAELLIYKTLIDDTFLLKPLLSYKLAESTRAYLGADIYGGSSSKSLGAMQTYNSIFTEIKYVF